MSFTFSSVGFRFVYGAQVAAFAAALTAISARAEVLDDLKTVEGVTDVRETTTSSDTADGLRRFTIRMDQPVDHSQPSSAHFSQKLVLFHRGYSEPTVLQTSGYKIFAEKMTRLASDFGANQIQVEHRYFDSSSPDPLDWSKLDIRQSAADFHNIVVRLKKLYTGHWVNTGASKGGMTSVFHRRFYPNDLDGTVADVAPLSFSLDDARYIDFVNEVGGAKYADCRTQLVDFQKTVLQRRDEILPELDGEFEQLGSKELALEHAVIELPFVFWQYGNPEDPTSGCGSVPSAEASKDKVLDFLESANDPQELADAQVKVFLPYFYQAAAELGAPGSDLAPLNGLLKFPYNLEPYLPHGEHPSYSNSAMLDVKEWVAQQASGLMFVYGEYDPWTAGAYRDLRPHADNHFYLVPHGNHGSKYDKLPGEQKVEALDTLARWLGKEPVMRTFGNTPKTKVFLEDLELKAFRRHHL